MRTSILDLYYLLLKQLLILLTIGMIVVVSMQVFSRFTGIIPRYLWTEEAARFCFVWIIMMGSAIAVRDRTHFEVDLLPHPKTKRAEGIYRIVTHLAMIVLAFLFVRYGYEFAKVGFVQRSEISNISMLTIYLAFPLAGLSWIVFLLEHILQDVDMIIDRQSGADE